MKTSLNLEDSLFRAAQGEARKTEQTISEVISRWAREGRKALSTRVAAPREVEAVDLGGASKIDLNRRQDWLDELDQ